MGPEKLAWLEKVQKLIQNPLYTVKFLLLPLQPIGCSQNRVNLTSHRFVGDYNLFVFIILILNNFIWLFIELFNIDASNTLKLSL